MKPIIFFGLFGLLLLSFQNCAPNSSLSSVGSAKSPSLESENHVKTVSIAPEIADKYAVFISHGKNLVVDDLIIELADSVSGAEFNILPGKCVKGPGVTPKISLQKWEWTNNQDDILKTLVLFHFLGHCVLDKADSSLMVQNGYSGVWAAGTIMNTRIENYAVDWWWQGGNQSVFPGVGYFLPDLFSGTPYDPNN